MNQRPITIAQRGVEGGQSKKIANGLVALSSAAVLAVYAAGYIRTRPAAERIAAAEARRKTFVPAPARAGSPTVVPPKTADVGQAGLESAAPDAAVLPSVVPTTSATASPAPTKAANVKPTPTTSPTPAPTAVAAAEPSPVPTPVPTTSPTVAQTAAATGSIANADGDGPAPEAAAAPAAAEPEQYKDGTYTAQGWGGHGFVDVTVVVEEGKIADVTIEQCGMRYTCDWITHLPALVVSRQSLSVDKVSGATDSTYAFIGGVYEALLKAH